MPTVNETIRDGLISHQIGLGRLSTGITKKVVKQLNITEDDILRQIKSISGDTWTKQRLNTILKDVRELTAAAQSTTVGVLQKELTDLSKYEANYVKQLIEGAVPVKLDMAMPSVNTLESVVTTKPLQGKLLKEWVEDLSESRRRDIRDAVRMGVVEGQTVDQIARRIKGTRALNYADGLMETSRRGAQAMTRTAVNHTATHARDLMYEKNNDMISSVQWVSTLDSRTTPICQARDGEVYPVGEGPRPPAHINCFIDHQIPIYTSKGWKKIGKIIKGDLVLTDKGRFKPVTKILRRAKQKPVVYSLIINGFWGLHEKLTVTEGHPVLINGLWTSVECVKPGDKLSFLAGRCKCGEKIPYFKNWCSLSCKSKHTAGNWAKNPKVLARQKKRISKNMKEQYRTGQRDPYKITQKAREASYKMVAEGRHPFQDKDNRKKFYLLNGHMGETARKRTSERMKKNNPMLRAQTRKKVGESLGQLYKKHPEKHPNYIMAQKGHKTWIEKSMADLLNLLDIEYVEQFRIDKYWVDFALPEYKIVIETDGEHWHQNKEKEEKRDAAIIKHGWQIIHFTDTQMKQDMKNVKSEVCRILNNHDGKYEFIEVEVERVESFVPIKAKTLYNFSVKDDESYIAKGFIVHNCRSMTVPVVKTWRELGFDIDEAPLSTRASMNGQVPEKTTYNDWLKRQTPEMQNSILGPGRAEMFRGGMSVDKFVDYNSGKPFTLAQLAGQEGVGLPSVSTQKGLSFSNSVKGIDVNEFSSWPNADDIERQYIAKLAYYEERGAKTVLRDSGEIVGIASHSAGTESLMVEYIATKRSGYGAQLFQQIVKEAAAQKKGLVLFASDSSIPFYEKMGMEQFKPKIFKMTPAKVQEIAKAELTATKAIPKVPVKVPVVEKFVPAKTIKELNIVTNKLGIGELSFDGYTGIESLEIGNETASHFFDLFNRFPKLQITEKQKLSKLWITKKVYLPKSDAFGRYYRQERAIDIGGEQFKKHQLKIGKTFSVGNDYFTTARHEFGHHYFEQIDSRKSQTFIKLVLKNGDLNGIFNQIKYQKWAGKYISEYAGVNYSECFAESFAAYTSPKYKIGMLPKEIESYFDDLLKG